jgi:hypothetical protein
MERKDAMNAPLTRPPRGSQNKESSNEVQHRLKAVLCSAFACSFDLDATRENWKLNLGPSSLLPKESKPDKL